MIALTYLLSQPDNDRADTPAIYERDNDRADMLTIYHRPTDRADMPTIPITVVPICLRLTD